jgi:hypothetical protein
MGKDPAMQVRKLGGRHVRMTGAASRAGAASAARR